MKLLTFTMLCNQTSSKKKLKSDALQRIQTFWGILPAFLGRFVSQSDSRNRLGLTVIYVNKLF